MKYHFLNIDDWYSSFDLSNSSFKLKTNVCRTLRIKKGMLKEVRASKIFYLGKATVVDS